MLRYLTADELGAYPALQASMFADRARQFRERLGWEVRVDRNGWERDDYDDLNPIYVIWQRADGLHGGSLRFLPTEGRTMVNEHFATLSAGRIYRHPRLWECTRFCLSEGAPAYTSAALMLGGAQLGIGLGLARAVGVFDARMVRIYRALGWPPVVLGTRGEGTEAVSVGMWEISEETRQRMARKAGVAVELSQRWFDAARAGLRGQAAAG